MNFDNEKISIYGLFKEMYNVPEMPFSLQKICPEYPSSIVESSKLRKCYLSENKIFLTFDFNIDYTQLISINLDTFTANKLSIKKPFIEGDRNYISSNSFLIDNYLYQMKFSDVEFILTLKDLKDNLIKSYEVSEKKPIIDFKNTDYI